MRVLLGARYQYVEGRKNSVIEKDIMMEGTLILCSYSPTFCRWPEDHNFLLYKTGKINIVRGIVPKIINYLGKTLSYLVNCYHYYDNSSWTSGHYYPLREGADKYTTNKQKTIDLFKVLYVKFPWVAEILASSQVGRSQGVY